MADVHTVKGDSPPPQLWHDQPMKLRWSAVVAFAGLITCGGDDEGITSDNVRVVVAETLCAHADECTCGSDYDECRSDLISLYADIQRTAEMADLKLDPDCVQTNLDLFTADCSEAPPQVACDEAQCNYWYGTVKKGEACEQVTAYASECEQGLDCVAGKCIDWCSDEPETAGQGETCSVDGDRIALCDAGLACDDLDTGTCLPRPAIGEQCVSFSCESGAYCDFDSNVCMAQVGEGESCSTAVECDTLSCVEGVCGPREPFVCLLVP